MYLVMVTNALLRRKLRMFIAPFGRGHRCDNYFGHDHGV